jgi:hypothetical protein
MERNLPEKLLKILETWFHASVTCVRWEHLSSQFFKLSCGIRQGGVLSPYLFAIYVDCVIEKTKNLNSGCVLNFANFSILVYADDILLISPTVCGLQSLLNVCENELSKLDMKINPMKSFCIRFGPDFKCRPKNLTTIDKNEIEWKQQIKYLGVYLTSKRSFSCEIDQNKRSFYMSFNSIFGKIGRIASEETTLHLVKTKCLPRLLYGLEVLPLNSTQIRSLEHVIHCAFSKIFNTNSDDIIKDCMYIFGFSDVHTCIEKRKETFIRKYKCSPWCNCLDIYLLNIVK